MEDESVKREIRYLVDKCEQLVNIKYCFSTLDLKEQEKTLSFALDELSNAVNNLKQYVIVKPK